MSEHWRLGIVERSVLEALDQLGARPDSHHRKCAQTVDLLANEFGVSPRPGYASLCAMSQPWLQQIRLVDFHGNNGSPEDDPASPRYTEARLAPAGLLVLAAERGTGAKVPVVLVNGNLSVDGTAPPFSPKRVIATLLALADDRALGDTEIIERVGPPESPTGCGMVCDHRVLAAGKTTELVMTARIEREDRERGPVIVLSHLPLGIGAGTLERAIAARVEFRARRSTDWDPADLDELGIPLRSISDESYGYVDRIGCEPRKGASSEECEARIAATWGVTTRMPVQLPAPLPELMRELVDEDPAALRTALASLSGG